MKRLFPFLWLLLIGNFLFAQDVQYLGLSNKHITCLKTGYGLIAVGTNFNGAFWQNLNTVSDTGWKKINIDSVDITAVYPHKSGPVGWAVGIGAKPIVNSSEFIFCSYLGGIPKPMSYGIDANHTNAISGIDGFPDLSICGETFSIGGRKLYRRFFEDTIWHSVYNLTLEGNFASLKARVDNQYVYAGGAEGFAGILLIRSSDQGNTWENIFPFCYVSDLDFFGQTNHKIIVTDRLKIMLSTNSGTDWAPIFQTDSLAIQKISFSQDGSRIYIVTNTIFYGMPRTYFFFSSNNGFSWETFQLPIYDIITGMDIDSDNSIYLASISMGVFRLKLPVVGIDDFKTVAPVEFKLYQNYPNPFNPSTRIQYQVSRGSNVSLKVYDVLGNEVATLVDEYIEAGRYDVEFQSAVDKRQLASGVYYYQWKAGEFVRTKKMILLR